MAVSEFRAIDSQAASKMGRFRCVPAKIRRHQFCPKCTYFDKSIGTQISSLNTKFLPGMSPVQTFRSTWIISIICFHSSEVFHEQAKITKVTEYPFLNQPNTLLLTFLTACTSLYIESSFAAQHTRSECSTLCARCCRRHSRRRWKTIARTARPHCPVHSCTSLSYQLQPNGNARAQSGNAQSTRRAEAASCACAPARVELFCKFITN